MKIGIISLGNIALKAYMPLYIENRDKAEFHFYTRDQDKLKKLTKKYGLEFVHDSIESLKDADLDAVMIHSPTHIHAQMIDWALDNGLHVFIDKPISDDIREVKRLIDKAESLNKVLFTGFNRRYAPFNQTLKQVQGKNYIIAEKHRENVVQDPQFALFDMMIHVVDTTLYLLDDKIIDHHIIVKLNQDKSLSQASLILETPSCTAISIINMFAMARPETTKLMSSEQGTYQVNDLNSLSINYDGQQITKNFSDWTPVLKRRGFESMLFDFIDLVSKDQAIDNQVSYSSHVWVDKIYQEVRKKTTRF